MNVDELVVTLNLDTKQFTQGQKDALESFRKTNEEMESRLKQLEATSKNVTYGFGNITSAAEGLFGALAGAGLLAFARDQMTTAAATGRMATNIGVATNELSAFGRMIERNGGDANTAMGSLKSLTDQVERFKLLGQASSDMQLFAGTIGADLNSSALDVYMKFVEWANKHRDDPKQVNIIGQLGGLDQGSINTALKGTVQVLREFNAAMKDAISPEQAAAMARMQDSWVTLGQKITDVGRDVVVDVEPAFTSVSRSISGWIEHNHQLADSLGVVLTAITAFSALKPALWILRLLGLASPTGAAVAASAGAATGITEYLMPADKAKSWNEAYPILGKIDSFFGLGGGSAPSTGGGDGGRDSAAAREARIRSIASSLGMDPEVAMRVARSEGFGQFSGDAGTSFGDFQLHVTPGGRGRAVGDQFREQTTLDPSNPANEAQADLFALQWAKRHGWHDFHGAARAGVGETQGINIEHMPITVVSDSKNPHETGRAIGAGVRSALGGNITTQANTGLRN